MNVIHMLGMLMRTMNIQIKGFQGAEGLIGSQTGQHFGIASGSREYLTCVYLLKQ